MSNKVKICAITTTRADYGVLHNLICRLKKEPEFELQLLVTGTHLSEKFGLTYKEIVEDGVAIDFKLDMNLISDKPLNLANSLSILTLEFSKFLSDYEPDAVLILGDRFELLPIATVCTLFKKPIIHFNGGELTKGAIDDQIRHSITKLSHLHFTSTDEFSERIIRMGEDSRFVYNIGTLGSENISTLKLLSKELIEKKLNLKFKQHSFIITYHPETTKDDFGITAFENLLFVLGKKDDFSLIFTYPNADTGSDKIIELIHDFVDKRSNSVCHKNLGRINYLSVLQYVTGIIGNSSSGIVEAPSFNISTINIGERQDGRPQASSVYNSDGEISDLESKLKLTLDKKNMEVINPYHKYDSPSTEVIEILKKVNFNTLFFKNFSE